MAVSVFRQGGEFLVNTETSGEQSAPAIARLDAGRFVVTWQDNSGVGGDTSGSGIKAQVFNADGTKSGGEFLVNTATDLTQGTPKIAGLPGGGFVAVWRDESGYNTDNFNVDIKARVFASDGTAGGEIVVNTEIDYSLTEPTVTGLSDGRFVVSWRATDTLSAQLFNADGSKAGSEFLVNTPNGNWPATPTIAALAGGRFVASWTSEGANDTEITAQIFNANGSKSGAEFRVNSVTDGYQRSPTITSLTNGGFVVSWTDEEGSDGDGEGIKAQIYKADGTRVGGELLVNTTTSDDQADSTITSIAGGGFIVSWRDSNRESGDLSGTSIKAQVYKADGSKEGGEFLINTATDSDQQRPSIVSLSDGRIVVSWQDSSGQGGDASNSGIKAQIFTLTDTNLPPTDIALSSSTVEENISTGRIVGTLSVTDAINDTVNYSIVSDPSGAFAVSDNKLVVQDGTLLDYETTASVDVTVRATDGAGQTFDKVISIGVKNVDESVAAAKVGGEILVNTATEDSQQDPNITGLSNGGFVVTWVDVSGQGGDTDGPGIKARLFNADGTAASGEIRVNSETTNVQDDPTITKFGDGGFIVSWRDLSGVGGDNSYGAVKAQVFDKTGAKVGGEFLVNTLTGEEQTHPAITGLSDGRFVVIWQDQGSVGVDEGTAIKGQIFNANGTKAGVEFLVNTQVDDSQYDPTVAALANGRFVIAWTDAKGTSNVKAQVFNADGSKAGGELLVSTPAAGGSPYPSITSLTNGGFVVSWEDQSGSIDPLDSAVKAQVYNASGVKVGGELLLNTELEGNQDTVTIAGLSGGGFVVSWKDLSRRGSDSDGAGVRAQIYNADGTRAGTEFLVNTQTGSWQHEPSITGLTDGRFVVSWQDDSGVGGDDSGSGIKAQIFQIVPSDVTADVGGDLALRFDAGNAATAGFVNAAHAAAASFTITGLDADATATVTFSGTGFDGNARSVTATATANGSSSVDLSGFQDGTITAAVSAGDTAGNSAPGSGATTTLDTTAPASPAAPTLVNDSGVAGDRITNDATIAYPTVAGGDTLLYSTDGGVNYSAAAPTITTDGTYTVSVRAQDIAGNLSGPSSLTFTRDTTRPPTPVAPTLATDSGTAGDNITNDATPTLTGVAEANATITLYDDAILFPNGARRVIGTTTADGNGNYSVTVENAYALGDGAHVLRVGARDAAGNLSLSRSRSVTIDTSIGASSRPVLTAASDTGAFDDDGITKDKTPTFTGTADANAKVRLYEGTTLLGEATANALGVYRVTASSLGDGGHSLHVEATDAAGNTSVSGSTRVDIDTARPDAPPAATLASDTGASGSDRITADATPTFTGTADPNATVTLYDDAIKNPDGSLTVIGTARADSNGDYAITVGNAYSLADGTHVLRVRATDAAGNTSFVSRNVTIKIDTTIAAPSAPVLTAATDTGLSQSDGITGNTTPTLTGTTEANATVALYKDTTLIGTATADSLGVYTVTASALGEGDHVLKVIATDAAGNVSAASGTTTITIDTTRPPTPDAPTLATDTGAAGDNITGDATPTLTGTVEAGATVTIYDDAILFPNGAHRVIGTATADSSGNYAVTVTDAYKLSDGVHVLRVGARDAAGNLSTSRQRVVTIDTSVAAPSAPVLTAASDTGESQTDGLTQNPSPAFTGTAEALSTVHLYEGTTLLGTGRANSLGVYTVSASGSLGDGDHALSVVATDIAGNVSVVSDPTTITIDTTGPATPDAPILATDTGGASSDNITSDATPTLTGTTDANVTVTLYDDAIKNADGTRKVLGTTTSDALGNYAVTVTNANSLSDGTHVLRIGASDAAGNLSLSRQRSVVIDTTDPAVAIGTQEATVTQARQTIRGTGEAGSGVTLADDDTGVDYGTTTVRSDGTWSKSVTLQEGDNEIGATAVDKAGNTATSGEIVLTYAPAAAFRSFAAFAAPQGDAGLTHALFDAAFVPGHVESTVPTADATGSTNASLFAAQTG